jgi:uncharacterized membrane protein
MFSDPLLAILGMAAVTLAIRLSGYLLADRLPSTGFVAAWMRHIPGAVLASLVAPAVASGGPAELAGTIATALAYLLTRNLFAAMAAGVAVVFVARTFFGA